MAGWWFNLQLLRLGVCNLCGLFTFAHDTKDGSKLFFAGWFVSLVRVVILNLVSLVGVSLVGSWLAVTCMPWSLCLAGWCAWLVVVICVPWSLCLAGWCAPCAWWLSVYLEPRVLGWCVLGWCGYLHALELGVLGRFVVGGYLHALELVP